MIYAKRFSGFLQVIVCLAAAPALAQTMAPANIMIPGPAKASNGLQKNQPIEISSDKLDVHQDEHKAIFTGNVIAVQGTTNLRAATMTVFYRDSSSGKDAKMAAKDKTASVVTAPAATADAPPAQGIYRIDAETGVVFTTPTETAIGDRGIYNVDDETIDLTGGNVTLTQGQNVLKGTHVIHSMVSGRSVMTSGNGEVTGVTNDGNRPKSGGRVHGLFIPQSDDSKAGQKKPPAATATPQAGGQ